MHGSTELFPPRPLAPPRRLILGTALALALVVWLAPANTRRRCAGIARRPPAAGAPRFTATPPAGDGSAAAANSATKAAMRQRRRRRQGPGARRRRRKDRKGSRHRAANDHCHEERQDGHGDRHADDREFDSFGELAHKEPALAIMIVAIVAVVFLAPVLAIALILGYRMRKARMQNETMLKLAERGMVPPAEAHAAVATGDLPPQVAADVAAESPPVGRSAPSRRARCASTPRGPICAKAW